VRQSHSGKLHASIKDCRETLHEFEFAARRCRSELAEIRAQTRKAIAESRELMKAADAILPSGFGTGQAR
jgi:hypothetical protein